MGWEGQPKEKEKANGLVGAKTGVGRANLRKKEKTNGLVGLKQGVGRANLRKKRKQMD